MAFAKPASMLATLVAVGPMIAPPISLLLARPDLVPAGSVGRDRGERAQLCFEVRNAGLGWAGPSITRVVIRRACGEIVADVATPSIEPKGSTTISVPMPETCGGAADLRVLVDLTQAIVERDESDNDVSIRVRSFRKPSGLP